MNHNKFIDIKIPAKDLHAIYAVTKKKVRLLEALEKKKCHSQNEKKNEFLNH